MDFLTPVLEGFGVALQPANLLFCLVGVTLGVFVGVLPGLGPAASIAILLPVTYNVDETAAIIMLAGIFYGALYGGTITAILLRLPGEASSAVTALDGYQMARKGRAGTALGIAALSSFVGGTVAIIALTFVAPVVAGFALDFGPPEFTALALLGILMVATLGTGSALKSVVAAALGLLLASIGQDPIDGTGRMNFGSDQLFDGIPFVIVAMGLFGVGEILYNLESVRKKRGELPDVGRVYPSRTDLRQSRGAMGRGSVVGFVFGVLPGGGAVMSSMVAYAVEKRVSRTPKLFGRGAIQGVAGPETASNAAASSSMIPLLSLGIPANASMAVIFGALLLQGITPGPLLVEDRPDLFWGVVNSMYLGNILLVLMCLPLIGLFVRIVRIPIGVLGPVALIITLVGVYTVRMSVFDMFLMIALGVVGYLMKKTGFEPAPLVLAFILGGILESAFRRSMRLFDGQLSGFFAEPISATLLVAAAGLVAVTVVQAMRRRRRPSPPAGAEANESTRDRRASSDDDTTVV